MDDILFLYIMFPSATLQLTSGKEWWRGPGQMNALPLYGLPGEALHRSQSLITFFTSTLRLILGDRNSRTIFYFLCVNLCKYTFIYVWPQPLSNGSSSQPQMPSFAIDMSLMQKLLDTLLYLYITACFSVMSILSCLYSMALVFGLPVLFCCFVPPPDYLSCHWNSSLDMEKGIVDAVL